MKSLNYMKYALIALVLLFCTGRSQAQCNISYSLGYSVFTGIEVQPNTTPGATAVIWTNVLTNGSASMALANYNCPDSFRTAIQNAINNATHYLQVFNQVGAAGGWQTGTSLCASCWNSEQNFQSTTVTAGAKYSWNIGAKVICSVGGPMAFYQFPGGGGPTLSPGFLELVEVAYTTTLVIGWPVTGVIAPVVPWCWNTTLPDWNPTALGPNLWQPGAPVQRGFALCYKQPNWQTWVCAPGPSTSVYAVGGTGIAPKGTCTKNP